jgi:CDP-glucose 4,6-dehydratase
VAGTGLSGWRGRCALVTGHTGFVGSWLATLLRALDATVVGFASTADPVTRSRQRWLSELGVTSLTGDVRDFHAVGAAMDTMPFDAVFHLAGQPLVGIGLRDPRPTLETNICGSINILEAARLREPPVVVHVTSDKCYRNRNWMWPYRETDEIGGGCPYSASKAAAELVFAAYDELFRSAGTSSRIASVRFGNVIGGGDHAARRLVPDCVSALLADQPIVLRRPAAVRPFQHVLDVTHGLLRLADRLATADIRSGEVFNFAPPGDGATALDLAQALVDAWQDTGGRAPHIVTEKDPSLPEDELLLLDGRKAANALDWRHHYGGLREAAASIVAWHRAVRRGATAHEATAQQTHDFLKALDEAGGHQ